MKILKSLHDCQDHLYQLVLLCRVAENISLEPCVGVNLFMASDKLRKKKSNFAGFLGTNSWKN